MAYLAAADDDRCIIEVVGDGDPPTVRRSPGDFFSSFGAGGFHHFCFTVPSVDDTISEIRSRGVKIVVEPVVVEKISRIIAFFADPYGHFFEFEEAVQRIKGNVLDAQMSNELQS